MLRIYARKLGDATILCLQGRIVNGETETLLSAVNSQGDARSIVLDLFRVSRVDAHGLGVLLTLREQTQSKAIDFKLIRVPRLIQQVLEITRLNTVFEISSVEEILSAASHGQELEVAETVLCA